MGATTAAETGAEPPEFSRGPAENEMGPPFWDWLNRIETWLEPLSATTRSGRPPGRSLTVIPTGSVPTNSPCPPLISGPKRPPPRPG